MTASFKLRTKQLSPHNNLAASRRWLHAVLVHEFGHSLAARCVGGSADRIILWPLGGLAYISHDAGPAADLWVTLAGPLTHIPQAGVWMLIYWLMEMSAVPRQPTYSSSDFGKSIVGTAFWVCPPPHLHLLMMYASERTCGCVSV
jgi:hypothetical protein